MGSITWNYVYLGGRDTFFLTKLFAQECSCLKGWFGQRVPLFGFAQRKSTCPLEIEQMVEKGKGPLSSQEKAGLFPESLGRGAKREVKGGPRGTR